MPIFIVHGTDVRRELWTFDNDNKEVNFYEALVAANKRRYELMPYIYSLAGMTYLEDGLIIKPLAYEFGRDERTHEVFDQYLFGDEMMVCPVTEAMYFGRKKKSEKVRKVYLPKGSDWYDFYTGERFEGGQEISAPAPLERIPVFVKAGAILTMSESAVPVGHQTGDYKIFVYPGADGRFTLYEDADDGYAYEKGEYTLTEFTWNDKERKLFKNGEEYKDKCEIVGKN